MNMEKKNDKNFYAMISRMKFINRWGLMRNTITENIAEHSFETAVIAHGLAVIGNTYFGKNIDADKVAVMAMFHDTSEIITGDMPTPVKYFEPGIEEAYKNVESAAVNKLLTALPDGLRECYKEIYNENENNKELYRYVKAADKISALIKCIEERNMGNTDFISAQESTLNAVKSMNMEEAEYFITNFLPPYSNTLDEQAAMD